MATTVTQELQDSLPVRDLQEPGDHAPRDQGLGRAVEYFTPKVSLPRLPLQGP